MMVHGMLTLVTASAAYFLGWRGGVTRGWNHGLRAGWQRGHSSTLSSVVDCLGELKGEQ